MLVKKKPNHVAITMNGHLSYSKRYKVPVEKLYYMVFLKINEIVDFQIRANIPVMTLYVLSSKAKNFDNFPNVIDALVDFFEKLKSNKIVAENKVKISILGKWYDLPGRVVEPIKAVIEETKDYDSFFLNLCINYDGQEEIVDACRIIGRKIQAGKLDAEAVSKEAIKDAIYSSYFLPPDIMIKTGRRRNLKGFLLWDSTSCHIHFPNKPWLELTRDDIGKAVWEWQKFWVGEEK